MDFLQVRDGFIKIDSPNREVYQDNAKHYAKKKFFIHFIIRLQPILDI